MTDLELTLRDLGERIAYPPTPDLASAVRGRLADRPAPRWRPGRRTVAIALAVLAVGVAAVMSVPSARTAILEFFHLGAVEIERVDTLPPARERPLAVGLGAPVPLGEAERLAGFRLVRPPVERTHSI